eukprot:SAG31_NODE_42150_length_273_cov_0.551724_1_plen_62_part_01
MHRTESQPLAHRGALLPMYSGWIGGGAPASQSLSRDLTLSSDYELLQQFVPEYKILRQPATY